MFSDSTTIQKLYDTKTQTKGKQAVYIALLQDSFHAYNLVFSGSIFEDVIHSPTDFIRIFLSWTCYPVNCWCPCSLQVNYSALKRKEACVTMHLVNVAYRYIYLIFHFNTLNSLYHFSLWSIMTVTNADSVALQITTPLYLIWINQSKFPFCWNTNKINTYRWP